MIFDPEKVESCFKNPTARILGTMLIVLIAWVCFAYTHDAYAYRGLFTGRNSFSAVTAIENCSALNRLIAYLVSFAASVGVMAVVPHSKTAIVTGIGVRTLQVYLLHWVVVQLCLYSGLLSYVANLP